MSSRPSSQNRQIPEISAVDGLAGARTALGTEALRPVLNAEEQAVMDCIGRAMGGILDLGLRKDTDNLRVELAAAVHALQAFPIQHMLQRLAPECWGKWFNEPVDQPEIVDPAQVLERDLRAALGSAMRERDKAFAERDEARAEIAQLKASQHA